MAWAALFLVVTAIAQFMGQATARQLGSAVQFNSDAALLIGLGWTVLQIIIHRHDAVECRRWWIAASAMGLLGLIQATDWLVDAGLFADDMRNLFGSAHRLYTRWIYHKDRMA